MHSITNRPFKALCVAIAAIVALAIAIGCYITSSFVVITGINYSEPLGVIDDAISADYPDCDIVVHDGGYLPSNGDTHGDSIIEFLQAIGFKGKTFFYSGADETGAISSRSILEGLNWLEEQGVSRINISLSSTRHNDELAQWVLDHPSITIYAAYNNRLNTAADYPAMYERVHASGFDSRTSYKSSDVQYPTNRILVINNGFHRFDGNTFLSVVSLVKGL